jgi:hypothetical protein
MIKFEHSNNFDDCKNNFIITEDPFHETIENIVGIFIRFLKCIGFNEIIIIEALSEEIESIKDSIRENYIMAQDDEETESW